MGSVRFLTKSALGFLSDLIYIFWTSGVSKIEAWPFLVHHIRCIHCWIYYWFTAWDNTYMLCFIVSLTPAPKNWSVSACVYVLTDVHVIWFNSPDFHLTSTAKKFYPSRQQLTLPLKPGSKEKPVVLNYKKSLKDYCDGNHLTVVFKDLGTQVSHRTLFFFEYLGPLLLYPIFYYFPVYQFFGYKGERVIYPVQTYAFITGVSTTSNELWKHFLCIGSAMQPHRSSLCFIIVHIIGPLALTLLTMWTTHYTPLLVTSKWRSALSLECFVKSVTSIAISCWGICAALMEMEDIRFHVVFFSILWHVQTTQLRFINDWVSILPHRLSPAMLSLWLLLLLWPIGPSQSTIVWRRLLFFNETFFTFCWTCLF